MKKLLFSICCLFLVINVLSMEDSEILIEENGKHYLVKEPILKKYSETNELSIINQYEYVKYFLILNNTIIIGDYEKNQLRCSWDFNYFENCEFLGKNYHLIIKPEEIENSKANNPIIAETLNENSNCQINDSLILETPNKNYSTDNIRDPIIYLKNCKVNESIILEMPNKSYSICSIKNVKYCTCENLQLILYPDEKNQINFSIFCNK